MRKPGGAPANVSACLGRLGGKTEFLGAAGDDAFGDYLINTLKKFGVGTNGVQTVKVPTTLAFVTLQDDGERAFIFNLGAGAEFVQANAGKATNLKMPFSTLVRQPPF